MLVNLIIFGIVIGANNMAAAIALGALGVAGKRWLIIMVFGFFETVIALIGLTSGHYLSYLVEGMAILLSSVLLLLLGLYTILSTLFYRDQLAGLSKYITSTKGIVMLALFLSVDNLIAGIGIGLNKQPPFLIAASIGVFSMIFTYIGLVIGIGSRRNWEKPAGMFSGSLLVFLAAANYFGWI